MSNPVEGIEIIVPSVADAIFKYTWRIKKYGKINKKQDSFDSLPFEYNANGDRTNWSLSVRYWKGAEGKRLNNPVVLCLNLLSSTVREPRQVTVAFQFGIYNTITKQWETCPSSRTVLNMPSSELMSVGYRDLSIHDRHLELKTKTMNVFVKIKLIFTELEINSLNQDLNRLLDLASVNGDVTINCANDRKIQAHKCILMARSPVLEEILRHTNEINMENLTQDIAQEIIRYIYTDRVDNLEAHANMLISNADKLGLPGLKAICERFLIDSIKSESVPSLLLLSEQFNCETLKKAVMIFCEDNPNSIHKTMAWKVLEMVNPDLFVEICEAGLGSSISSNLDSDPDSNDLDVHT
ncbi:hypothetical protein RUM43_014786 [Polyplax serrata]|uniref:BTB domain-containing protein n=1 Tax=Polyplax serrata TaxID=468196 RepID=A0AAN8P3R3_POLSC